ncbi:hypothetical protein F5I97DRAFT_976244 [Phlebopus sp. FC_14]|nr:hypothetical protein F5I97DRAFT_976244 [Phlebopus sp. FC_14]
MKFTVTLFALTAVASTAYAGIATRHDGEENIPACVKKCLESNIGTTKCNPNDTACLCTDKPFIEAVGSCVKASCSASDIQAAEDEFHQACPNVNDAPDPAMSTATTSTAY